jgi:flagellar protein FliL
MSATALTPLATLVLLLSVQISPLVYASEHGDAEAAPKHEAEAKADDAHAKKDSAPTKKEGDHGAASEGGEHGGASAEVERIGAIYVPFKPAFVVNYGGPGRLKYIKTDISVRVQNNKTATAVQRHMPYLRNNIVMLLSAQTEEAVSSQEGKDALRKNALAKVRDLIHAEEKLDGVIDLYFTTFLVQH